MAVTLGDALLYIKGNRDGLDETLSTSKSDTKSWASSLGGSVNKLVGGVIVGAVAAGTAAIVSLGVQAFSTSSQINDVVNNFQSGLNVSREEAEALGEVAVNVFKNNFGDSIAEAGNAVEIVRAKLSDLSKEEMQQVTEDAFKIRDAFDVDVGDSIAATSTLMKNFGLTSKEATDFIAAGFQDGLPDDFLDTINEYSTQFAETGATADQFFSVIKSGAAEGALGTDKAADMIKEFRLRILDGSSATDDAIKTLFGFGGAMVDNSDAISSSNEKLQKYRDQLALAKVRQSEFNDKTKESTRLASQQKIDELTKKIQAEESALSKLAATQGTYAEGVEGLIDFEGGMTGFFDALESGQISQIEAFDIIRQGLANVEDESTRMQLGVALMGTQFEDLGTQAALSIDLTNTKMEDLAGATDALEAQYNNLGSMWEGFRRRAILALRPVGDKLLEIGNRIMPRVQTAFDWFERILPPIMDVASLALEGLFNSFEFLIDLFNNDLLPVIKSDVLPVFNSISDWILGTAWPAIQRFGLQLWEFLKPLIAVAGEFVGWKDVLMAVGSVIVASLIPVLGSVVAAAAPVIATGAAIAAVFAGLVALFSLIRNAWENDWNGIRTTVIDAWESTIKPSLFALWEWLKVRVPEAIMALQAAWSVIWPIISEFLSATWEGVLKPVLTALWEWLKVRVPEAIKVAQEFFNTILLPALKIIGDFLTDKVVPVLSALYDWLKVKVPQAIQAVKQFWDNTLYPVLEQLWIFMTETVLPIIADFVNLLMVDLVAAFIEVKAFWDDTLKPVLQSMYDFFVQYLLPVWDALLNVISAIGQKGATEIKNAWEKIKPVLEKMKDFIADNVTPKVEALKEAFGGLNDFLGGVFKTTLESIKNLLNALKEALDSGLLGLKDFLGSMAEWLNSIAGIISGDGGVGDDVFERTTPEGLGGGANQFGRIGTETVIEQYNLTIYSSAPVEPIVDDFNLMKARRSVA